MRPPPPSPISFLRPVYRARWLSTGEGDNSWNAAAISAPTDPKNPLEVPEEAFDKNLDLMVKSPYVAAREAARAWKESEQGGRKGTFIMTGNLLPRKILPVPTLVTLGVGKSGANYWVGLSDVALKGEGIR